MSIVFTPGWDRAKLAAIPDATTLATQRTGLSGAQQKKQGIHPSQITYAQNNNAKRQMGEVFLTLFNETDVRNAVQKAQSSFNQEASINALLQMMIGNTHTVTVDQGTHQEEDAVGGGFMLHFDARRPGDNLCFHLYVGQNPNGSLKITEISYMSGGNKVTAHPTA